MGALVAARAPGDLLAAASGTQIKWGAASGTQIKWGGRMTWHGGRLCKAWAGGGAWRCCCLEGATEIVVVGDPGQAWCCYAMLLSARSVGVGEIGWGFGVRAGSACPSSMLVCVTTCSADKLCTGSECN